MSSACKAVADPVHGTIQLTPLETKIISTRAFQRLRQVKQLGLANMVFPGADYSRFSHCLGVCHVTGRILDALNTKRPGIISPAEQDRYRLAGLLHDVGHYPFSHATEDALKDHFSAKLLEPASGASDPIPSAGAGGDKYINHEKVGILTLREKMRNSTRY